MDTPDKKKVMYKQLGGVSYIASRLGISPSTFYSRAVAENGINPRLFRGFVLLRADAQKANPDKEIPLIDINLFAYSNLVVVHEGTPQPKYRD